MSGGRGTRRHSPACAVLWCMVHGTQHRQLDTWHMAQTWHTAQTRHRQHGITHRPVLCLCCCFLLLTSSKSSLSDIFFFLQISSQRCIPLGSAINSIYHISCLMNICFCFFFFRPSLIFEVLKTLGTAGRLSGWVNFSHPASRLRRSARKKGYYSFRHNYF